MGRGRFRLVTAVPAGNTRWNVCAGPAGMKWPKDFGAAAGLALHMHQRHGVPL
jgi:hypothetical protein